MSTESARGQPSTDIDRKLGRRCGGRWSPAIRSRDSRGVVDASLITDRLLPKDPPPGGGDCLGPWPAPADPPSPPNQENCPQAKEKKLTKGARNLRISGNLRILGTQTFFWPLPPPPPPRKPGHGECSYGPQQGRGADRGGAPWSRGLGLAIRCAVIEMMHGPGPQTTTVQVSTASRGYLKEYRACQPPACVSVEP